MMNEIDAAQGQLSPLVFLLATSGLQLFAMGIVFTIWGIVNWLKSSRVNWMVAQCFFSLLPAIIAAVTVYFAYVDFSKLASAQTAPKPTEIASITGRSMSIAFCGIVNTVVPVALGLGGILSESRRRERIEVNAKM